MKILRRDRRGISTVITIEGKRLERGADGRVAFVADLTPAQLADELRAQAAAAEVDVQADRLARAALVGWRRLWPTLGPIQPGGPLLVQIDPAAVGIDRDAPEARRLLEVLGAAAKADGEFWRATGAASLTLTFTPARVPSPPAPVPEVERPVSVAGRPACSGGGGRRWR